MTDSTNMTFSKLKNTTTVGLRALFSGQNQTASKTMVLSATDGYGNTVLHVFVEEEAQKYVDVLMNYSFSVELLSVKNANGETPLHIAGGAQNSNITKALLEPLFKEYNVTTLSSVLMIPDQYGKSHLHFIAQSPKLFNSSIAQAQDHGMLPEMLSLEDIKGNTAMHFVLDEKNEGGLRKFFDITYGNYTLQASALFKRNTNGYIPVMFTVDHAKAAMFNIIATSARDEHLVQMLQAKIENDEEDSTLLKNAEFKNNQPLIYAINNLTIPKVFNYTAKGSEGTAIDFDLYRWIRSIYPISNLNTSLPVNATGGTATINGSKVHFMPAKNFNGTVVFPYTVSCGAQSATAHITVIVDPVNDAPTIASNVTITVTSASPEAMFLVPVTDSDNATSTLAMTCTANQGTSILKNCTEFPNNLFGNGICGSYTLNNKNFVGQDTITYTAFDGANNVTGYVFVAVQSNCTSNMTGYELSLKAHKAYLYHNIVIPNANKLLAVVSKATDTTEEGKEDIRQAVQDYRDSHKAPCKFVTDGGICKFPLSGNDAETQTLVEKVTRAIISKTNTVLQEYLVEILKSVNGDKACLIELVCAEKLEVVGDSSEYDLAYNALCGVNTTLDSVFPDIV